ncbi:MAG: biotin/lipoyl-binding protein [Pseudomonadaceae bacterium]|nr:biotin/lipoyl-binding protein [Pseudomonadaceae bacterium]
MKSPTRMNFLPRKPKQKQLLIALGILAGAVLTSVSIFATGPNAEPVAPVEKAWPVSVTPAEPQTLKPSFSAFGRLESNRIAHLRSDLVARIEHVAVQEGDWVNKGDLLIQLDDRESQLLVQEREAELVQHKANLASMRNQLDLEQSNAEHFVSKLEVANAKLARHQDLMTKRLIARGLLDDIRALANQATIEYRTHQQRLANLPNEIAAHEARVAKAGALLAKANLDLEKTRIRAPFAGPILAVLAATGDHSNLSMPLIEMADSQSFEVRVQIPESYAAEFSRPSLQNAVLATTEAGQQLILTRLAAKVSTGQTGMDAFFSFKQTESANTLLGRVFNLTVELPAQTDVIAVPVQSIYDNNRVYSVVNNRLVGHTVQRVGELESETDGYRILIRSDELSSGAPIVATQLPRAITGLLVDIANAGV